MLSRAVCTSLWILCDSWISSCSSCASSAAEVLIRSTSLFTVVEKSEYVLNEPVRVSAHGRNLDTLTVEDLSVSQDLI